jgi:hypothetical protein
MGNALASSGFVNWITAFMAFDLVAWGSATVSYDFTTVAITGQKAIRDIKHFYRRK